MLGRYLGWARKMADLSFYIYFLPYFFWSMPIKLHVLRAVYFAGIPRYRSLCQAGVGVSLVTSGPKYRYHVRPCICCRNHLFRTSFSHVKFANFAVDSFRTVDISNITAKDWWLICPLKLLSILAVWHTGGIGWRRLLSYVIRTYILLSG